MAVRSLQPSSAIELLEKGADPNTLTIASHDVIRNEYTRRYNKGQTALDIVRDLLRQFRKTKGALPGSNEPLEPGRKPGFYSTDLDSYKERPSEPFGTAEFLGKFEEGSYQHWLVSTDIKEKLDYYKIDLELFEKQKTKNANLKGLTEKLHAIEDMISQLERVEKALEAKDAKTFKQQYPDIPDPDQSASQPSKNDSLSPYSLDFKFRNTTDVTDARKVAYLKL